MINGFWKYLQLTPTDQHNDYSSVYLYFVFALAGISNSTHTCWIPLPCSSPLPARSGQWPENKRQNREANITAHIQMSTGLIQLIFPPLPSQYQPAQTHKSPLWWCDALLQWWTDPVAHTHTRAHTDIIQRKGGSSQERAVHRLQWSLPCQCRCQWPDLNSWWPLEADREEGEEHPSD